MNEQTMRDLAQLDADVHARVFGAEIICEHGVNCADIPPYSDDMAAAMLVVEQAIDYQLASVGLVDHSLRLAESPDHRHRADLWFGKRGTENFRYAMAIADTLPEAICRAALKAMEDR